MAKSLEIQLSPDEAENYFSLIGLNDRNSSMVEQEFNVHILLKEHALAIVGEPDQAQLASSVIKKLLKLSASGEIIDAARIRYISSLVREGREEEIDELLCSIVAITHRGRQIRCKTAGQQKYVETIKNNNLTFAVGPAGTGKTYLAMALAVVALKNKEVDRIVLTRPAVEAGEKLGFLPGDLTQKVDPYLRPLYDALYDFIGMDAYQRFMEKGIVEVAPLAYMRGRTLSDSFIILDEAQNTTSEQMKMFLTRFGFRSKVVVTGDLTQTDLQAGKKSGLREAVEILKDVPGIGICQLTAEDVVRHELVQKIIEAYENAERGKERI